VATDVVDRDGVRIMAERCPTCIFRAGNLMHLRPGVLASLLAETAAKQGHIVCHDTLDEPKQAVCRGFADGYGDDSQMVQLAYRLGFVKEIPHE
jgi:hypothetical protein